MQFLQFDKKKLREERKSEDNLVAIRELFEIFNARLQNTWILDEEVTINETLRKFCRLCQFKVYNLADPGKFGILFSVITDPFPYYVYEMIPYTGLSKNEKSAAAHKESNKVGALINALTVDIRNAGWNIVIDHYYGHLELMQDRKSKHNLTVVATIQADQKGVPEEMKKWQDQDLQSMLFAWNEDILMVDYVSKDGRTVLMIFICLTQPDVPTKHKENKAQIILGYKEGGVDVDGTMLDIYPNKTSTQS